MTTYKKIGGPGGPPIASSADRSREGPRLERFRAKWIPVRVKKTRQNKNLEPGSDSIRTEKALAGGALVFEDRAEQFPALAVELHHLQLLVDAIVVRRGVGDDARQVQVELDVLEAGRLLHDVLAGQIVAARLQHMDQQLRGGVAIGVEARILVAIRIILGHELKVLLHARIVLPGRIERVLAVVDADHALGGFQPRRLHDRADRGGVDVEDVYRLPAELVDLLDR